MDFICMEKGCIPFDLETGEGIEKIKKMDKELAEDLERAADTIKRLRTKDSNLS